MVEEKTVLEVVRELGKDGKEFHTTELAVKLTERLGVTVETGLARYWAKEMVVRGILERRSLTKRLQLYRLREV